MKCDFKREGQTTPLCHIFKDTENGNVVLCLDEGCVIPPHLRKSARSGYNGGLARRK